MVFGGWNVKRKTAMEINKIYNEDCLETLKRMPSGFVDLVVTSPPYNMRTRIRNGQYTTREKSEHFSKKYKYFSDDMPIDEYYNFHKKVLCELLRVSKCICYNYQIVTGSKEAFFKLVGDFSAYIKDIMIWEKVGQPAMHENVLNSCYEYILILESNGEKGRVIKNAKFSRGTQDNVIKGYRNDNNIQSHGACFPTALARKLITLFSDEGNLVYDPFIGSGTTAVACVKENRNFIGSEISSEYAKLAENRIKIETSQLKLQL